MYVLVEGRPHKLVSHIGEVMEAIPMEDRVAGVKDVDLSYDDLPTEKAHCCVETDMFIFHNQTNITH